MIVDSIGFAVLFLITLALAIPLGAYMKRVYNYEKCFLDVMHPFERWILKTCGIEREKTMNWKHYLLALLSIQLIWIIPAFVLLLLQGNLFLNPAHVPGMEWSLALNSAVSFITSTNLQHYSGESGASYLSQIGVFTFLQFVSAATSLTAGVAIVRGLSAETGTGLGNFFNDFLRSCTRILLPISFIVAIIFMIGGVPMTFKGPDKIITMQHDTIHVARGPVAAMVPIKELGSNGGGFFGANDAHPFENPSFITYIVHYVTVLLLPMAFIFFHWLLSQS